MIAVLLMSLAAAIGVGYLGAVADDAVEKLHEIPAIRRAVGALFLFPVVNSVANWTERRDRLRRPSKSSRAWPQIRRWLIAALVIAALAIVITVWFYFSAISSAIRLFLWGMVAVVLGGLWFVTRR